jgi:hypothetical protein
MALQHRMQAIRTAEINLPIDLPDVEELALTTRGAPPTGPSDSQR